MKDIKVSIARISGVGLFCDKPLLNGGANTLADEEILRWKSDMVEQLTVEILDPTRGRWMWLTAVTRMQQHMSDWWTCLVIS